MSRSAHSPGVYDLLKLLRDGRPRTRADLVDETGLTRGTVSLRVDTLRALGLVVPFADAASTGGRPSARIVFNPSVGVVGAVDLGATYALVALCDLAGTVLTSERSALDITDGPEPVLGLVCEQIRVLLARIHRDPSDLLAIGIGVPGPVEHSTGRPSNPPIMPGWDGFDVPREIQRVFSVPVLVDNDVNVMALGEYSTHQPPIEDMIFVKIATGIGSGIISEDRLQRGANGTAGDIGHISVTRGAGVTCRCGNVGCLEAVAAAPAIAAVLRTLGEPAESSADIVNLVRAGNLKAIQAVRQAGRDVGEVLNMCVSIVNPSAILIGGSLSKAGEHLLAGIREVVYGRSAPLATKHLSIEQSHGGDEVGVRGASMLAIERVLDPETLEDAPLSRLA